nr:hypothetical protein [Salinisphaera japonica]
MNDNENPAKRIHSQSDETWLTRRIWIFDRQRRQVPERLFGMSKAHAMLFKICSRLVRVKLNVHLSSMHHMHIASQVILSTVRSQ